MPPWFEVRPAPGLRQQRREHLHLNRQPKPLLEFVSFPSGLSGGLGGMMGPRRRLGGFRKWLLERNRT
jgi:hypothetical protein